MKSQLHRSQQKPVPCFCWAQDFCARFLILNLPPQGRSWEGDGTERAGNCGVFPSCALPQNLPFLTWWITIFLYLPGGNLIHLWRVGDLKSLAESCYGNGNNNSSRIIWMHEFRGCHLTPPASEGELTKGTVVTPLKFPSRLSYPEQWEPWTLPQGAVAETGTKSKSLMEITSCFWMNRDTAWCLLWLFFSPCAHTHLINCIFPRNTGYQQLLDSGPL